MPRKKKHPKDMTTDEAIKHIFHPKIVRHVKKLVERHNEASKVKRSSMKGA